MELDNGIEREKIREIRRVANKLNGTLIKKGGEICIVAESYEHAEKIERALMTKGIDIFSEVIVYTVDDWLGSPKMAV